MNDEFPTEKEHSAGDEVEKDLLGDPVNQKYELIGAPEHKITEENQEVVRSLYAVGWTQERIARRLGVDPKTLRKHYSRELDDAADELAADATLALVERAKAGNVAAARLVLGLVEKGQANALIQGGRRADEKPADANGAGGETGGGDAVGAVADQGKKEALRQGAAAVTGGKKGSRWGAALDGKYRRDH